jgi:cytochrome P450
VATSIPGTLLLDDATIDDPAPFYRRLVAEAPVWRAGDSEVFTVSSYELLTEAAARVGDFSSNLRYLLYRDDRGLPARHVHGPSNLQVLATADPPLHAVHRRLMLPAFSPARLAILEKLIGDQTARLLEAALPSGATEFMSAVANRVPIEVVIALVGFKDSNPDALLQAAFASTDILAAAIPRETLEARASLSTETARGIGQQLEAAIREPGDGILGGLAVGVRAGEIDGFAALAILHILLSAGGESTTSLIGNSVRILADDLDLQRRLRANPALVPAFVEEVLRLEAPFRQHMRWVPKGTNLGGVEIPEGSTVLMMWGAANRDPAKFERPDEVDLERPRRHVTFGSGIHTCLGNALARLEARVVLQTLLRLTDEFVLNQEQPPTRVKSLAVRRYHALPLVFRPS